MQRVRASLRRGLAEDPCPRILVACSGGQDSVVLAHVLASLARTGDLAPEIVHVDHGVRPESGNDAGMVAAFARELEMPFHLRQLETGVVDRHPGTGVEEALRRERYQAIADVAAEAGTDFVALGHHERDQAETVLLHLIRGSGLGGAAGMREWSTLEIPWWTQSPESRPLVLWRPLLAEPLAAIEAWHQEHRLPLAEDETNTDSIFRRNAIRHEVLPLLDAITPGATTGLARFAALAAEDNAVLDRIVEERLGLNVGETLPRRLLEGIEPAIQRRMVRQWILTQGFDGDLSRNRVEAVREIALRNRSGAIVQLGANWNVLMARGELSIVREIRVP